MRQTRITKDRGSLAGRWHGEGLEMFRIDPRDKVDRPLAPAAPPLEANRRLAFNGSTGSSRRAVSKVLKEEVS